MLNSLLKLLPASCVVCGKGCSTEYSLCSYCSETLPWISHGCRRCGCEQPTASLIDGSCGRCLLNPPPLTLCSSLFSYGSPVNKLITSFKFNGRFDVGYALSSILAYRMKNHYAEKEQPQLLIPIPLHSNRLRTRGFNQAIEICRVVSARCGVPMSISSVSKVRDTPPQSQLSSARSRKSNLRHAFAIEDNDTLQDLDFVILIDDVITTMTTMVEVAKLLKYRGISRIDAWSLARANR